MQPDTTDIENSRERLEKSINHIRDILNHSNDVINDIILKFNIIPNSLITGFLLSTNFICFLQKHSGIKWLYMLCIITFLLALISISIYAITYEQYYDNRENISLNQLIDTTLTADEIIKIDETVNQNNIFPKRFKHLIKIKLFLVFLNLLFFSLFITITVYKLTYPTQFMWSIMM